MRRAFLAAPAPAAPWSSVVPRPSFRHLSRDQVSFAPARWSGLCPRRCVSSFVPLAVELHGVEAPPATEGLDVHRG